MTSNEAVRYAGFWIRFVANIIDNTLLTLASWLLELMLLGAVYWFRVFLSGRAQVVPFSDAFDPLLLQVFNVALYSAVASAYYIIGHYRYGTTLGKRPFGVYVVDAANPRAGITLRQSVIRCVGYFVSYLPFGAGYLMAAFHPEKRALHDLMAGTVSIRRP